MENIFICGGGSAVPGVGSRLLQSISAHLPPSMQPVLCPVPEYMPDHTGMIRISFMQLYRLPNLPHITSCVMIDVSARCH